MADRGNPGGAGFGWVPDPRPGNDPRSGLVSPAGPEDSSSLVRPYAVTGGRTQPRYDLPIEALISTAPYPPREYSSLTPEYQAIINLCRGWRSVAEVSALLRLPLGVARVLIADMAHEGLLHVNQTSITEGQRPGLHVLERVLSGLRKL